MTPEPARWLWTGVAAVRQRYRATSPFEFILDLAATVGTGVQVSVPVFWAATASNTSKWWKIAAFGFLGSVLFGLVHRHILARRFRPQRLVEEERRRPLRLSEAIARFTTCVQQNHTSLNTLAEAERCLLEAVRSQVETQVGDVAGTEVAVALVTRDSYQCDHVCVINRADTSRPFPKSYPSGDILAGRCISTGNMVYEPDFKSNMEKPYRSIICYPLVAPDSNVLGSVSIDHVQPHAFANLPKRLAITLSPYLRLLELALVYRMKLRKASRAANKK